MIKNHLKSLIDARLIVCVVIIIAISVLLTMLFSDKVGDFAKTYKKKFYIYTFSFVLVYALVAFLGYNKLFVEISDEFLFYQITTLLFGILNVYLYRWLFQEFHIDSIWYELLFSLIIICYSSVLFIIIHSFLNGLDYTFLMCTHFLLFIVPTGVYIAFNFMMKIPPRKFITWAPLSQYKRIESSEMEDILLITLLIRKEESNEEYASIRTQAPLKVDFGRLFYLTIKGYNKYNQNDPIELSQPNGKNYNWVFYLQPKWYEKAKYVDAGYYVGLNGITENSVVICQREVEKNEKPKKDKKADDKVYGVDTMNEGAEQERIDELQDAEASNAKIK